IRSLKVKHTDAFGYFIEVSKANLTLVPDDYQRKQTLVGSERFVTDDLVQHETDAKTAGQKLAALERELFESICAQVSSAAPDLARSAHACAVADVLLSLAAVARELNWSRAKITRSVGAPACDSSMSGTDAHPTRFANLKITGGRHPLVEHAVGESYYTKNDCYLSPDDQQIMLVTGPNMGGKSTYLRMVATIVIINQLGGFVPADDAQLPVFDRVYTRVGAQDRLARGQSTFMVEMMETAEILNTCGDRSLIILDEVGRGTSTYDGISIAKAVVEYLHQHEGRPLVLFATHFFELTDLPLVLPRVKNLQVEVAWDKVSAPGSTVQRDKFVFLYRVSPGAASDSFGIEVAEMAGLPQQVVDRARHILAELEEAKQEARERARAAIQLGLFASPGSVSPEQ
ncbi:DNA mismatch repair protein MutS, partial [bacterium]|nr:DNA mismatch repair protein MutS [bacterium]